MLAAMVSSTFALAQDSLVDLLREGHRETVMEAITTSGIDLDAESPDGSTVLHWATYMVDHELVSALLEAGARADIINNFGSSPLSEAVKLADVDLVRMLLEAGANPDSPNQDNQTALMLASYVGSLEIAELLIEHKADVNVVENFRGQTALMWAAGENHPAVAELLVEHGADVTVQAKSDDWPRQMTSEPRAQFRPTGGLTALLYAARSGCTRCAIAIVEAGADINRPNPDGITPLINALDNKSFDIAMYLIDQGAKVDVWDMNGRTPLYVAVDMNSFVVRGFGATFGFNTVEQGSVNQYTAMDVVNRLLEMGVDTDHQLTRIRPNGNGRGRFADYMMRGGTGPLMVATLSYDNEAIETLLAYGAEVDLPNVYQITPLMAAAGMTGNGRGPGVGSQLGVDIQDRAIATIDLLLEGGADINARILDSRTFTAKLDAYIMGVDHEGQTALFAAADLGWNHVVEHLIKRGADPTVRDAEGQTALDIALKPIRSGVNGRGQVGGDKESTIAVLSGFLSDSGASSDESSN